MLSAVAARKARLQGKDESTTPTITPAASSVTPPQVQARPKRKHPAGDNQKPLKKKKQKQARISDVRQTRYFEEVSKAIILSDSEDDSVTSESEGSSTTDDDRILTKPSSKPLEVDQRSSQYRAWSPSRNSGVVSRDFSEVEDEDNGGALIRDSRTLDDSDRLRSPSQMSTYCPTLNENFFHLSKEEVVTLLESHTLPNTGPGMLLTMSSSEKVALFGSYAMVLVRGRASLSGVTLNASTTTHSVFSSRCSPIPVITSLPTEENQRPLPTLPERCLNALRSNDTALLVQTSSCGIEGLGRICRVFESVFVPPRWNAAESLTEGVHLIRNQSDDLRPFFLPKSWSNILARVDDQLENNDLSRQVFLVKGAKKSGKSTFSRTLLNTLLTRYQKVAFLECDVGQSEFTPGGMVSLHVVSSHVFGAPFTHQAIPYKAHYVGSSSPRNSPSYYMEAIQSLIHAYNVDVQHGDLSPAESLDDTRSADVVPLVVNTMGWTKGLGADLSKQLEEAVEPSAIFDFQSLADEEASRDDGFSASASSNPAVKYYRLESIPPSSIPKQYTAVDYRNLSLLSYFHARFPSPKFADTLSTGFANAWDTTLPLCAQSPYEIVATVKSLDLVVLTGPDADDVVPSELHRVLNGALVGLVSSEPGVLDLPSEAESLGVGSRGIPYIQGATPPSPSVSTCLGIALVRSVFVPEDPTQESILHLLTPIPPSYLSTMRPRILVKGDLEIPVWGILDHREGNADGGIAGHDKEKVPYLRWGKGEGVGAEKRRIRRNLMRKGQQ